MWIRNLLLLLLALFLTMALPAQTVSVVTSVVQASSPGERGKFETALAEAIRIAGESSAAVTYRAGGRGEHRIDVTAVESPDSRFISLTFTGAAGATGTLLIRSPWDELLPRALSQGIRYFEPMIIGYPGAGELIFEDYFPLETIRPPSSNMGMVGLYPTGLALKPEGSVVVAGTTFAVEVDEFFRVVGYPGAELLDQGTFNYARAVATTPAGTVYFLPSQGNDIYRLIEGVDRVQRLRVGVGGYGPFTVLPDGTIITIDAIAKRAAAISGREREEINLFPYPDAYIGAAATGPAGNIWVFDTAEQRISIVTPEGRFVDTIIPAVPQMAATQTAAIYTYPTGEFLLLTRVGLWKLRRDGQPIWSLEELPPAANTTFQQTSGVVAEPGSGRIYIVDGGNRMLLRFREAGVEGGAAAAVPSPAGTAAGALAPKRASEITEELVALNRELGEQAEEPELLLRKAELYEELDATELAETTFQHVLDVDPFSNAAAEGLERVELARLEGRARRLAATTREQLRTLGPASAQRTYLETLQTFEQILARRPGAEDIRAEMDSLRREFSGSDSGGGGGLSPLRIEDLAMDNLFPGLFSTYRTRPVGSATLTNRGEAPITGIRITAELRRYSDFPTETASEVSLAPGETMELPFRLILNSNVFEVEEDLPLQARINVAGESGGQEVTVEGSAGFTLYRRSALTWSETERLAGFITPNEGNVSRFALSATNAVVESGDGGFSRGLLRAARIADALGIHRVSYVEDPQTPISAILGQTGVVDTVRLPRTTLLNRAGDCDDTTALLCSLYEAAGIPTAIVTTPDHVLMAFDTGEPTSNRWLYEEAGFSSFLREGSVWLPVETTVLSEGFFFAVEAATRRINEAGGSEAAGFVTTQAARSEYPTIPVLPTELNIPLPPGTEVRSRYEESAGALRERVYLRGVSRLEAAAEEANGVRAAALLSQLGALHNRFGTPRAAEEALRRAVRVAPESMLPRIHLATLYVQTDRAEAAVEALLPLYEESPEALLVNALLARAYYDMGENGEGRRFALVVEERSPELARRYGIGGASGSGRAAGELDRTLFSLPATEEEL